MKNKRKQKWNTLRSLSTTTLQHCLYILLQITKKKRKNKVKPKWAIGKQKTKKGAPTQQQQKKHFSHAIQHIYIFI